MEDGSHTPSPLWVLDSTLVQPGNKELNQQHAEEDKGGMPQGQVQGWEPMPVRTPRCKQQR